MENTRKVNQVFYKDRCEWRRLMREAKAALGCRAIEEDILYIRPGMMMAFDNRGNIWLIFLTFLLHKYI